MLLVSNSRLGSADAVSIQLRRMLPSAAQPIHHCFWGPQPAVAAESVESRQRHIPYELAWRPPVGRGVSARLWDSIILPARIKLELRSWGSKCGPGYIVVDCQAQARYAMEVLEACGVSKYILHLMDLLVDPLDTIERTSPLGTLIVNAWHVNVVSERLARRIGHLSGTVQVADLAADPEFFPGSQDISIEKPTVRPVLVSSGNLYNASPQKLRFIREDFLPAWRDFQKTTGLSLAWMHCGPRPKTSVLPEEVESQIEYLGFLSSSDYRDVLNSSACALLPIEHLAEEGWAYSLPSRLIDYLAAGIPTLLPPCENTATADFAKAHETSGIYRLSGKEECLAVLHRHFGNLGRSEQQTSEARKAIQKHHPEKVRARFTELWTTMLKEQSSRS